MEELSLKEKIEKAGIENCLFLVPMQPVQTIFGLISFTSSEDEEKIVPAKICENRYKVEEDYKISLRSIDPKYGVQHYYKYDLRQLIDQGSIEFFIRG